MPRWVAPTIAILAALALVPFACVARARVIRSPLPRFHLVPDMDDQGKLKAQQASPLFADGRAMRPPVPGTVARGMLQDDDHYYRGIVGDDYALDYPAKLAVDLGLLERGRERYGIFCSPCHGLAGYGDGMVSRRADELLQGTWVPPSSFHEEPASTRRIGHLYNTISNGIRNMPAYGSQIDVEDRWAIVTYVRALQRSQRAGLREVPVDERSRIAAPRDGK